MPRAAGPFPITAKFGDNAYQVDLPADYNVTNTFNIGDLQMCTEEQELRSILPQEGGVEPYSYPSEHGPSPEELQAVPSGQAVCESGGRKLGAESALSLEIHYPHYQIQSCSKSLSAPQLVFSFVF